jgi:putative phage-type endonuclease
MNVSENTHTNSLVDLLNIHVYRENIEKCSDYVYLSISEWHDDILEYTIYLIDMYMNDEIGSLIHENFDDQLEASVTGVLKEHIRHLYHIRKINIDGETENRFVLYDDAIVDVCERFLDIAYNIYYTVITPKRSYIGNAIRRKPDIIGMTEKLQRVRDKYQPEQRSEDWYKYRHEFLTASSIGKVFGTPCSQNQLIVEKCNPHKSFSGGCVNTNSPLHHGQKYEPVSVLIYEGMYKTKVGEFGCIRSSNVSCIGASPDGINIDPSNDLYGRMLEIKNVVSRVITGTPKCEYWIQMQFQMYVCDLKECDFLETKFVEYRSREEFIDDGSFIKTGSDEYKGIILMFDIGSSPIYEYKPIDMEETEFIEWKANTIEKYDEEFFVKEIYWKLDVMSCVLVLRNDMWLDYAIPKIQEFWKIIERERVDGFEHRLPAKKKANQSTFGDNGGCLIDLDEDDNVVNETTSLESKQISITNIPGFDLRVRTQSFDDTKLAMTKELNQL